MRKLSPLVIAVAGSVALPAVAQTPPATTPLRKSAAGIPSGGCCTAWVTRSSAYGGFSRAGMRCW